MLSWLFLLGALAPGATQDLVEQKTLRELRRFEQTLDGVLGVAVIDLATGRSLHLNGNAVFPQASVIKISILAELFRAVSEDKVRLDAPVTLTKSDVVGGSGRLQRRLPDGPVTLSLRELAAEMIEFSDNTATNKLIAILGAQAVNANNERLGLKQTRLGRIMLDSAAAARDEENLSTPIETARLLEMIYRKKLPGSAEMLSILKTVDADFRAYVPSEIPVAAKPGSLNGVRNEAGIVFLPRRPFVMVVMSAFLSERVNPVPGIIRIVYDNWEKLDRSNRYGNRVY